MQSFVTAVPDQQICHSYIPSSMLRLDHIITDTDVRHTKALSLLCCYYCVCVAYCRPFNRCIRMMVGVIMNVVVTHASLEQLGVPYRTLCLCMLRYVILCACMLWHGVRNAWCFSCRKPSLLRHPRHWIEPCQTLLLGPLSPVGRLVLYPLALE